MILSKWSLAFSQDFGKRPNTQNEMFHTANTAFVRYHFCDLSWKILSGCFLAAWNGDEMLWDLNLPRISDGFLILQRPSVSGGCKNRDIFLKYVS